MEGATAGGTSSDDEDRLLVWAQAEGARRLVGRARLVGRLPEVLADRTAVLQRIWAGRRPQPSAISRTASEGTKHASTALWNHVGWAEPRSVTTVANGIGRSRQRLMSARI